MPDADVWADIQRYEIPEAFEAEAIVAHADEDILKYRYWLIGELVEDLDLHSAWVLQFFGRTSFFCMVGHRLGEVEKASQA